MKRSPSLARVRAYGALLREVAPPLDTRPHEAREAENKSVDPGVESAPDRDLVAVGEQEDTMLDLLLACRRYPQPAVNPALGPPVFPLPAINGQPPVLLVFDHTEMAIDVAYEKHYLPGGPLVRSTTRDTTLYCIPRLTPVFVVNSGTVVHARKQADGHMIVVDHGNKWLTVYSGLEHMFVPSTDLPPRRELELEAGDMLGYLGASKPGRFRPLHFELWRFNRLQGYDQIDPLRYMRRWHQVAWKDARLEPSPRVA